MERSSPWRRPVILALFFISGACGLLYELVWIRMAGTIIGNTTYAVGTVVAVFMGGLAWGAWRGGRAADRRSGAALLRLYGTLEAGVALSAAIVPFLFAASDPLFRVLWNAVGEITPLYAGLRILLVTVILIVPTGLMGATLPVLSRFLSDSRDTAAREAGRAYAINTLGGGAGTLAAGFWMIPTLGLRATLLGGSALNLTIGLVAILLARGKGGAVAPTLSTEPPPRRLALAVSAISGLASLAYEVAWSRSLALSLGSSIQALTLILAAFILGLALGSAIASRFAARTKEPTRGLALLQAGAGLAAILLLPLLGDLPIHVADLVSSLDTSYEKLLLAEFALIALAILVPATILGAVFPFACRLAVGSDDAIGRTVGAVYTWNTLGSIAGTLVATFGLVPLLGLSRTIRLAATLNLGVALFLMARSTGMRRGLVALPAAAILLAWILPSWKPGVMTSGSYLYGKVYVERARETNENLATFVEKFSPPEAEYWDAYGLASVHRLDQVLTLRVNGKPDASTARADMRTQLFVGHVPLLHHPAPRRVLVIGLGAGFTLGAVTRHEEVEKIDCVELSSAVVRAASHFDDASGRPLQDRRRVHLIVGDGRNLVRFTRDSYDVIISEPSNLWVSGMANLFTKEFFEEVRARLTPGGIFGQWMCAFRLDAEDFRRVLHTFYDVFPEGSVWEVFPGGDYLFLGSDRPNPVKFSELETRLASPGVKKDLDDPDTRGALGLSGHLVTDARGARAHAGTGPLVTDDRLTIEFTAPRSMHRDSPAALLTFLNAARSEPVERTHFPDLDEVLARRISRQREERRLHALSVVVLEEATKLLTAGQAASAIPSLLQVPRSSSLWAKAQILLGKAYGMTGQRADARARYREVAADPTVSLDAFAGLAQISQEEGLPAQATGFWREAIRINPNMVDLRLGLVSSLMQEGRFAEAKEACLGALRLNENHPQARKILEALERR